MKSQMALSVQEKRHQVEKQSAQDRKVDRVPVYAGSPFDGETTYHLGILLYFEVDVQVELAFGFHDVPLGIVAIVVETNHFSYIEIKQF